MKLRQLFESTNSVGLIFGRFNPPHKGHKAAWKMAAKNDAWYVGTNPDMVGPKTHTGKGSENKDPLPYNIKIQAMKLIMPEVASHIVPHESWFSLASKLYNDHGQVNLKVYTDESWVINTLEKYNGSEGRHGYYEFSKIQHIPTPRITSASNLRMAVKNNNPKEFAKLSGVDVDAEINGNLYFDIVKKYLAMGKGVASVDESIFGTKRVKPVSPTSDRKANPIFPNKKKTKPAPTRYNQQDHVSLSPEARRLMKNPNHHNTNEQATDRLGGMGSSREWENPHPLNESALTALRVATKAHKGQFRKSGGEYIVHPKEVARFVKQFKKSNNLSALIQAAYLHDTLEDTDTTYEDLVKQFGALVADMVQELTTDKEASDAIGKGEYIANKMAKMSSWALVVKLADRLANVQDIDTRPEDFQKKYAAQTTLAIKKLRTDRYLSNTHNKIISAIEKKIKEYIPNTNEQDTDRLGGMGSSREWENPQPPSKYHNGNRKNKISSNPISNNVKTATDYDVEIPATISPKSAAIIRKVLARQAARAKLQGK
jgi:hypothetical protein